MTSWSKYQEAVFGDVKSGAGHTVVEAFAGSGKTTTIMEALRHVPRGCTVLMVAFNKSIATELQRRAPSGVEVKTLHGYGLKACSRAYGGVRIDNDRAMNLARCAVGNKPEAVDLRKALCRAVSLAKGALAKTASEVDALLDEFGIDLDESVDRAAFVSDALRMLGWCKDPHIQGEMRSAREREGKWITFHSNEAIIDFDDMVWLPVSNELRVFQFDRVFVDETQDLNPAQIALSLRACKKNGRICAVGDARQAIYAFRGADKNAMRNVVSRLGAKVLPLSITYRCARAIVRVAQTIVPNIEAAPGAEEGEVRESGEKEMLRDAREGDFILSRTNAPLVRLCLSLLREGRRANVQGRDIGVQLSAFIKKSKCKTIEDLLAYTEAWCEREVQRMLKKDETADTTLVEDRAATISVLAEQSETVAELLADIESLFSDDEPLSKIVLSTTHKAKGLERERVWLLADTYLRVRKGEDGPNVEEQNLYYVASTRAKQNLFLVKGVR